MNKTKISLAKKILEEAGIKSRDLFGDNVLWEKALASKNARLMKEADEAQKVLKKRNLLDEQVARSSVPKITDEAEKAKRLANADRSAVKAQEEREIEELNEKIKENVDRISAEQEAEKAARLKDAPNFIQPDESTKILESEPTKFVRPKVLTKAQSILERVDTAEKAVALRGAERQQYLDALDEVHGPQAERAKKMGFGDKTYYHGTTADIHNFDNEKLGSFTGAPSAEKAHFFSDNPDMASSYALGKNPKGYNIPAYNRTKDELAALEKQRENILKTGESDLDDPMESLFSGKAHKGSLSKIQQEIADKQKELSRYYDPEQGSNVGAYKLKNEGALEHDFKNDQRDVPYNSLLEKAASEGKPGTVFKNTSDTFHWNVPKGMEPTAMKGQTKFGEVATVFEPNQIRSTNAAFDPRFANSSKILAGAAAMPMADSASSEYSNDISPLKILKHGYDKYAKAGVDKALDKAGGLYNSYEKGRVVVADKFADIVTPSYSGQSKEMREQQLSGPRTLSRGVINPLNLVGGVGVADAALEVGFMGYEMAEQSAEERAQMQVKAEALKASKKAEVQASVVNKVADITDMGQPENPYIPKFAKDFYNSQTQALAPQTSYVDKNPSGNPTQSFKVKP